METLLSTGSCGSSKDLGCREILLVWAGGGLGLLSSGLGEDLNRKGGTFRSWCPHSSFGQAVTQELDLSYLKKLNKKYILV